MLSEEKTGSYIVEIASRGRASSPTKVPDFRTHVLIKIAIIEKEIQREWLQKPRNVGPYKIR